MNRFHRCCGPKQIGFRTVRDHGCSITNEYLQRIIQPAAHQRQPFTIKRHYSTHPYRRQLQSAATYCPSRTTITLGLVGTVATTAIGYSHYHTDVIKSTIASSPTTADEPISFSQLNQFLSSRAPRIGVSSKDIRILHTPNEFYETVLELSSKAESRILLSSLYLGTGPLEQKLIDTIKRRMEEKPNLRVEMLFDYLRGTREVGPTKESSVTAVRPLLKSNKEVDGESQSPFQLHLLHVPSPQPPNISFFRSFIEQHFFKGNKLREAVGVHHMKFYVFDDYTIISGANLSDTYFTNRQDRYIVIRNAALAQFHTSLIQQLKQLPFTYRMNHQGQCDPQLNSSLDCSSPAGSSQCASIARSQLMPLFQPNAINQHDLNATTATDIDTWIFPTIQMGSLHLTHDEELTASLLQLVAATPAPPSPSSPIHPTRTSRVSLDIATGYMNLTDRYQQLLFLTRHPNRVRVITAGPKANGWTGAKGAGKYIPDLYSAIAYDFLTSISRHSNSKLIHLLEWSRDGCSYHAKGLWLSLPTNPLSPSTTRPISTPPSSVSPVNQSDQSSAPAVTPTPTPVLTLIGSTNFGRRSVQRDTESSLILLTQPNSPFAQQLQQEQAKLLNHTNIICLSKDTIVTDDLDRESIPTLVVQPPAFWLRVLAKLARPYM